MCTNKSIIAYLIVVLFILSPKLTTAEESSINGNIDNFVLVKIVKLDKMLLISVKDNRDEYILSLKKWKKLTAIELKSLEQYSQDGTNYFLFPRQEWDKIK